MATDSVNVLLLFIGHSTLWITSIVKKWDSVLFCFLKNPRVQPGCQQAAIALQR